MTTTYEGFVEWVKAHPAMDRTVLARAWAAGVPAATREKAAVALCAQEIDRIRREITLGDRMIEAVTTMLEQLDRLPPQTPGPWPFGPEATTLTPQQERVLELVGRAVLAVKGTCAAAEFFHDWLASQGYNDPSAPRLRSTLWLLAEALVGSEQRDGALAFCVRRMVDSLREEEETDGEDWEEETDDGEETVA